SFHMRWRQPRLLQTLFHLVGNGLDLPRVGAAANHEVVGECARSFFQFKDGQLLSFLVMAGVNGFSDLSLDVVIFHSGIWPTDLYSNCSRGCPVHGSGP